MARKIDIELHIAHQIPPFQTIQANGLFCMSFPRKCIEYSGKNENMYQP